VLFPNLDLSTRSATSYGPAQDHEKYTWQSDSYGGGYIVYTGTSSKMVYKLMEELRRDKWLDKSSRALEVSFTVYNGNYQLFTSITLQFKMFATGLIEKEFRMGTFRIEGYSTPTDIVRLAIELLLGLYILVTTLAEMRDAVFGEPVGLGEAKAPLTLARLRANLYAHLGSTWNWIDAVRLGLSVACVIGWIMISFNPVATELKLPLPPNTPYYDFEPLVKAHKLQTKLVALAVAACLISFFKFANYSDKYGMIVRTITRAGADLLQFLAMFFVIFVIFDVMGMMMFGTSLEEWSSFISAFQTLIMMLTVEYGMEGLIDVDPISGTLFYALFLMLGYFLLVNILLAILIDAYTSLGAELSETAKKDKLDLSVIAELWMQVRMRFFILFNASNPDKVKELHTNNLTTGRMLGILVNPEWKEMAVVVKGEPTLNDPHPKEEYFITYNMLKMILPVEQARQMMASVGEMWEKDEVESFEQSMKRLSSKLSMDDLTQLDQAGSVAATPARDVNVARLETQVAGLCEQLAQRDKKLDRLLALLESSNGHGYAEPHPFGTPTRDG